MPSLLDTLARFGAYLGRKAGGFSPLATIFAILAFMKMCGGQLYRGLVPQARPLTGNDRLDAIVRRHEDEADQGPRRPGPRL